MEITKIKGNTYYIKAPTNIGVYIFKNKNCLLIDTGIDNTQARKIDEVLINNGLHPKYIINTHSHYDHCGGNIYFQNNYPGCIVYSSYGEKLRMENTYIQESMLFSADPIKELNVNNKVYSVDFVLDEGQNKINDEKFEVVSLKGHSVDQIGIITPEKVCFLGDSIFSEKIIEKYSFPYLYNISESLKTLDFIKEIDGDFFAVSHSDDFVDRDEILKLCDINITNIEKYKNQILELLDQPLTREDICENLTILNDLVLNFKQYHLNFSTVSAFITYLYGKDLLEYSVENGKLYYYKKQC